MAADGLPSFYASQSSASRRSRYLSANVAADFVGTKLRGDPYAPPRSSAAGLSAMEAALRNFTLNVGPQKPNISLRETVQQGGRPPRVRRSISREGALCGTARSHE